MHNLSTIFKSHIINREHSVTGRCVVIEMNTLSYPEFRGFLFEETYVIGKELGGVCLFIQFSLVYLFRRLLYCSYTSGGVASLKLLLILEIFLESHWYGVLH